MIQDIKAPVSVQLTYNHRKNKVFPTQILWDGKKHIIKSVGLHFTYREGRILYHAFSVSCDELSFKLVLNTENLFWVVEQIFDGEAD